jgi:OHCU decarboxylase
MSMEDKALAEKPSGLSRETFLKVYGSIYEHSPWIAEMVYDDKDVSDIDTVFKLSAAMRMVVDMADHGQKLSLIRAHPELAVGAAEMEKLAAASATEQQGAGLHQCTQEELGEFKRLNGAYREKFGFPFIVAVKGLYKEEILNAFRKRLDNDPETEFENALAQIHKIALFRLEALI